MKNDCHLVLSHRGSDDEISSVLVFDREVPIRDGTQNAGRRYVGLCFDFDSSYAGVRIGTHHNTKGDAEGYTAQVIDLKRHIDGCDNEGCGGDMSAELLHGPSVPA